MGGKNAGNQEETITISYSEQKKAAQDIEEQSSAKKKQKTTPAKSKQVKEMTSEEKRVKFGTKNHSKSYKASMKALKTVKHTPNKTPEHGILRRKIASPASEGAQSSKKKKVSQEEQKVYRIVVAIARAEYVIKLNIIFAFNLCTYSSMSAFEYIAATPQS